MVLDVNKYGKPLIKGQADYDEYVSTLPNGRRLSGLNYDETNRGVAPNKQLKGTAKRLATEASTSEFKSKGSTSLHGDTYQNYDSYGSIANRRLVDDTNYYSLQELIEVNRDFSSGRTPNPKHDPFNVLKYANLHLTSAQITELQKAGVSNERVFSARMISFGTAIKEKIDAKGWTVKNVHVAGINKEDLRFTVQAGNNQIDILGFTSSEKNLGDFYTNGNSVFRERNALIGDISGDKAVATLMPQIQYFMEGADVTKLDHFDVFPAASLPNVTTVGLNKTSELKRTNNGNRIKYDASFNIGHNTPSKTKHQDLYLKHENERRLEARTLTELVEQAYQKAAMSSDMNEVDSLVDLDTVRLEDGSINLDRIDMEVLIRESDMTLLMKLIHEKAEAQMVEGQSIEDVRNEILYGKDSMKQAVEETVEFTEEAQNNGYDEDGMDVSEDNGAFVQQGARERIANLMVGMTDENNEPFSGWMDMSTNSNAEEYSKTMNKAKRAAQEAGVRNFEGRFDNDGVLHWNGDKGVEFDDNNQPTQSVKVNHKLGQFFFPAREDEYNADGELIRKKGVMQLHRGNGKEDLRVDNYDLSFTPPTKNRSHILERLKISGLDQKMNSAIHASIKSQVLTRTDERFSDRDVLYDTTRVNKAYENMARISHDRMLRPGVVEHLRNSFLIDKSYLDRDTELREESSRAKSKEIIDKYGKPQSVRLPLRGLEGVYDAQASSDGETLGLRGYFTEEFMSWIDDNKDGSLKNFETDGQLGMLHKDKGQESALENWVMGTNQSRNVFEDVTDEIPSLDTLDLTNEIAEYDQLRGKTDKSSVDNREALFNKIYESTRDHRFMYASPMVRKMRGNYAQYDSPDRVLMTAKMAEVATDIIGGPLDKDSERSRVRVALMTVGGLTFEDSIPISAEFAEQTGRKIGDKLADNHSNKGIVGYITGLDPSNPAYNEDVEQAFKDAKASGHPLDMIQSPYGMTSRANMGLGKELINANPENKGAIYYQDGPHKGEIRGHASEISVIVTNMDAEHKTNMYELQDLGRYRTFSYQQALALQSHGASKTLATILGDSERKHADLLQYQNVIGFETSTDSQLVQGHYGMLKEHDVREIDGAPRRVEQLDPSKDMLVVSSHDVIENGLPTDPSYLSLPITRNAYLKDTDTDPVLTTHLSLLPERLRRETKTYDGEYVEHDYTAYLGRITDFSSQVEDMQMEYLTTYERGLDHFRDVLDKPELTADDIQELRETNDPAFMREKALYSFEGAFHSEIESANKDGRETLVKGLEDNLRDYSRISKLLNNEADSYERSVEKDQFGIDHRSKKRSFVRRRILSNEMRNSATAILTNDTSLELDTVGISPALGINSGVLEAVDKVKWQEALDSGDPSQIHAAARGNWQVKKGTENDKLMVWRDPVLHDGSVFATDYRVDERLTGVSIHPMMTATMGADFDGDTFGVAHIADKDVQKEWAEKLNVRYNMMDARNKLAILNVGMDNVDYMKEWIADESDKGFMAQVPWAKDKLETTPEYFENTSPKGVLNDYIEHIEDTTWKKVDEEFVTLSNKRGFDYSKYDEIAATGNVNKSRLSDSDKSIVNTGSRIYDEAYRKVVDEYMYDTVESMTDVVGKNAHNYRARYVDITNEQTLLESQRSMAKDGAKGKLNDIKDRNESYLMNGVTHSNIIDVRTAQKAKVDEIGRSGSQTLKVTPILADQTFFRGRRAISGATIGMDVTETASQSILQIKHSPDDVPAALRFLRESPKFFEGHRESFENSDETKPVWMRFSSEMLGKTESDQINAVHGITAGEEKGPFEKASNGTDSQLAKKLDAMLVKAYNINGPNDRMLGSVYVDINHGVATNKNPNTYVNPEDSEALIKYYKDEERIDWKSNLLPEDKRVPIDGTSAYRLAMKTIYSDAGLNITDEEVDYYQSSLREADDSPRENAGLVNNYQRNLYENTDALDIFAQHGAEGVRNVAKWNDANKNHPKLIAETDYSKPYQVNYGVVHNLVDEEFSKSSEAYEQQKLEVIDRRDYVNELRGMEEPLKKVVGEQTYIANDYQNLSKSSQDFLKQFQAPTTPAPTPTAVPAQTEPVTTTSTKTHSSNPFANQDDLRQVVKANDEYAKKALSDGRSTSNSSPDASDNREIQ